MNEGLVLDLESATMENENFRKVLFTALNSQLVVMSLKPGEEIGMEVHHIDQFIKIESGAGKAVLNGEEFEIADGSAIVVPSGTEHNIVNESEIDEMKLYTVYSPPEHAEGTIHRTKEEAIAAEK